MIALARAINFIEKRKRDNQLLPNASLENKTPKWRFINPDNEVNSREYQYIKVTALGDPKIGLTALFNAIMEQKGIQSFRTLSQRKFFDFKILVEEAIVVKFTMVIVSEQNYIPPKNVVLLCFSLNDRKSFQSMQTTWLKRFDNFCNVNAHTFVVGLQADTPVENRAVHALPNEALPSYFEVSAKEYTNIDALLDAIVKAVYAQELHGVKNVNKNDNKAHSKDCTIS